MDHCDQACLSAVIYSLMFIDLTGQLNVNKPGLLCDSLGLLCYKARQLEIKDFCGHFRFSLKRKLSPLLPDFG